MSSILVGSAVGLLHITGWLARIPITALSSQLPVFLSQWSCKKKSWCKGMLDLGVGGRVCLKQSMGIHMSPIRCFSDSVPSHAKEWSTENSGLGLRRRKGPLASLACT